MGRDSSARDARLPAGTRMGGYRVEGVLGVGGMGVVYRAVQLSLGRPVALKLLDPALLQDATQRRRFVNEGVLVARVAHPALVRVLEVGQSDDRLFLAYELIEGQTLRQRLDALGPMTAPQAAEVTRVCAEVLSTLHAEGILHRDVKTSNIFLSPERGPLLGDLGIAKDLLGSGIRTEAGVILGTPDYMAPELFEGHPATAASDLYALGIVLFECLDGRPPFESEDPLTTLKRHATESVPDLRQRRPELPPAMGTLLGRALAKRPEDRFSDAAEMADALRALPMKGQGVSKATKEVRPRSRLAASPTTFSRPEPGLPQPPPARGRGAARFAALGLAAAAAIVIGLRSWPHAEAPFVPTRRLAPPPASVPAPPADLYQASVLACMQANKRGRDQEEQYRKFPGALRESTLPEEMLSILEGAFEPAERLLTRRAVAVVAGEAQAVIEAGLVACHLLALVQDLRSNIWMIRDSWEKATNRSSTVRFNLRSYEVSRRFDGRAGQLAGTLLGRLPRGLVEARSGAWTAGLVCLKSLMYWSVERRLAAPLATEMVRLSASAVEELAYLPRPKPGQIECVAALLTALGYADIVSRRAELLALALKRFETLGPLTPGQRLMRWACRSELLRCQALDSVKPFRTVSEMGESMQSWLQLREEMLHQWPYDVRAGRPTHPTPEQVQALPLHETLRSQYDDTVGFIRGLVARMNGPMPPGIEPQGR